MAGFWLVACAVVIPAPKVSLVIFILSAAWAGAFSADFPDLAVWAGVSLFLAFLSFLGWRGKRKAEGGSQRAGARRLDAGNR